MGLNMPLINSCCCLSLKTGAIIMGGIQLFFYTLYCAQLLIGAIRYSLFSHIVKFDVLIRDLLFIYVDILNVLFGAVFIIGVIKESSCLVSTWLLIEVTRLIDVVWHMIMTSFMYFHLSYFIEEFIFFGFELLCSWIGYSYYAKMPKNDKYIF